MAVSAGERLLWVTVRCEQYSNYGNQCLVSRTNAANLLSHRLVISLVSYSSTVESNTGRQDFSQRMSDEPGVAPKLTASDLFWATTYVSQKLSRFKSSNSSIDRNVSANLLSESVYESMTF